MYYVKQLSILWTVNYKAGLQDYEVCVCYDKDTADMIAQVLNDEVI